MKDYFFKEVFSDCELYKSFVQDVLEVKVDNLEVCKDVYLDKEYENDKYGILDIKATVNENMIVNTEMQVRKRGNELKRMFYYAYKMYSSGYREGDDYTNTKKIISIWICNFNLFETSKYMTEIKTVMAETGEEIKEAVKIIVIELPKFGKVESEDKIRKADWSSLIRGKNKERMRIGMEKNEEVKKAYDKSKYLTGDAETRRREELREKYEMDMKFIGSAAFERGINKGKREGIKAEREEIMKRMEKLNVDKKLMNEIFNVV